jgi:hypothetical protein
VRAVQPRQGFKVLFRFDNGVEREIDLEPHLPVSQLRFRSNLDVNWRRKVGAEEQRSRG